MYVKDEFKDEDFAQTHDSHLNTSMTPWLAGRIPLEEMLTNALHTIPTTCIAETMSSYTPL